MKRQKEFPVIDLGQLRIDLAHRHELSLDDVLV
jgi:hypothetical protein